MICFSDLRTERLEPMVFARVQRLRFLLLLLPLLFLCAARQAEATAQAAVPIPDTPAGKQLAAFLAAFNTGDRATLKAFLASNFESPPNAPSFYDDFTDQQLQLYKQSGGFTVRQISNSASAVIK